MIVLGIGVLVAVAGMVGLLVRTSYDALIREHTRRRLQRAEFDAARVQQRLDETALSAMLREVRHHRESGRG